MEIFDHVSLVDFPRELVGRLAEFLEIRDALNLACSSKKIYTVFPLVTLNPAIQLLPVRQFFGGHSDTHRMGPEIPVVLGSRTHSIVLETRWRDQGYGNRKGVLFVIANDSNATRKEVQSFSIGRLVKASPLIHHDDRRITLHFRPKPKEVYHLWIHVGGGGGHEIQLTAPLKMYTIVFDTEHRSLSRAFQSLQRAAKVPAPGANRASDFWPGLLRAASHSMAAQLRRNEPLDPFLSQYLESNGFDTDYESLVALIDLCSRFGNTSLSRP